MKKILLSAGMVLAMGLFVQAQKKETVAPPPPPQPPAEVPAPLAPPKIEVVKFEDEFLTRNKNVSAYRFKSGNKIVITIKDRSKEEYNLKDAADVKRFEEKYGALPTPPPPPPAPPKP
ncbi:MAG: hypothetical protein NVV59_16565 [Chitinophagaceae bacterium]|nr:hypothetical protein [Chitinophagaceae bacterium]